MRIDKAISRYFGSSSEEVPIGSLSSITRRNLEVLDEMYDIDWEDVARKARFGHHFSYLVMGMGFGDQSIAYERRETRHPGAGGTFVWIGNKRYRLCDLMSYAPDGESDVFDDKERRDYYGNIQERRKYYWSIIDPFTDQKLISSGDKSYASRYSAELSAARALGKHFPDIIPGNVVLTITEGDDVEMFLGVGKGKRYSDLSEIRTSVGSLEAMRDEGTDIEGLDLRQVLNLDDIIHKLK